MPTIIPQQLHLVCHKQWMVNELSKNSILPIKHSLGLDIPTYNQNDAWWIPQGIANRFIKSEVNLSFQAPGAYWLDTVPEKFKNRKTITFKAGDIEKISLPTQGFWKFAEAKVNIFPAEIRTRQEVTTWLHVNQIPSNSVLQYSEPIELVNEYRFFIVNGHPVTGSIYLTRKNNLELTYYDYEGYNETEYVKVASEVGQIAPLLASPAGYVLDVATTPEGKVIVLEANPAWCSAWYGCNIDQVVKTIIKASVFNSTWSYKPDAFLVKKYNKMVVLNKKIT